jgi:hypothetical protein
MAFELVSLMGGAIDQAPIEVPVSSLTAAKGTVAAVSGNVVIAATSSSTVLTIFGVFDDAVTSSMTFARVIPVFPWQVWKADTTNNTHATNQTLERCALTDASTVNNTGSDVASTTGVFQIIAPLGAVGDKKVLGRFLPQEQVTA